jgi:hypothetical protein
LSDSANFKNHRHPPKRATFVGGFGEILQALKPITTVPFAADLCEIIKALKPGSTGLLPGFCDSTSFETHKYHFVRISSDFSSFKTQQYRSGAEF